MSYKLSGMLLGRNHIMHIITGLLFFTASSCRQEAGVFEKNTPVPSNSWSHDHAAKGKFIISDTLALYDMYIVLRHLDSYNYNNIWLNVGLKGPGDSMYVQKVNLTLASDAGGWEGSGMNDIWEVRKLLNDRPRRFIRNGEYEFEIRHIMRDDPLDGIMSAGFRVEKAVKH